MKIVFLIIDYMPHQLVSIQALIKYYDVAVTAFVDQNMDKCPDNTEKLVSISTKNHTRKQLLSAITDIDPAMLVVAGWAIRDYVWLAKRIKTTLKIPTVAYSDSQWRNTLSQNMNCVISRWHVRKAFSHLWVAGTYQFEYARRLGFKKEHIIFHSISCDVDVFDQIPLRDKFYPKKFLFIGRMIESKGIDLLLDAWSKIKDRKEWQLTLIGDGPLKEKFTARSDVDFKGFMTYSHLSAEIKNAGCFVFPSVWDQWAVVIHEAAAGGLPIIATNICGATPHFVINGYNGFSVNPHADSIRHALERIINTSDDELITYGARSKALSKNITPEIGAANLMSIIKNP